MFSPASEPTFLISVLIESSISRTVNFLMGGKAGGLFAE